ncbi:UvrD-helicase domain-containing protein [Rossellomorea aquimaris]|uniref:DNA 3'-5' helicase n=1 Tax=Rossellomorea aquimaris TaxID=189382 RepID=A0A366EFJ9_9BACI|nr:ATP-dependent helicase [Rossellomorea aquimaris]RBP01201.1 DNA helicase-2/ATP-dependent DNA helicase PcrA [Rossellomorea aquimaris]
MDIYKEKLALIQKDAEQLLAYKTNQSTVVKAGPGSGKTTVITLKIMKLLTENINEPRGLACITYSKDSSKEFSKRLHNMGYQKRENVYLGTVHSFCISQVIIPYSKYYRGPETIFLDIISQTEKKKLFNDILIEKGIGEYDVRIEEMDTERSHSIIGHSNVFVNSNELVRDIASVYEKRLKELHKSDFIEIIKYSLTLIRKEEYVRKCLESKFPWILVDEYQDFGKPLHELILAFLKFTNIKIFAVGDPDQSIYGFNGAHPDYFFELYENFGLLPIELKTNYRSNQDIIDASTVALDIDDREYKAGNRTDEKAEFHFISCKQGLDDQYKYVTETIIPDCLNEDIPLDEICVLVKDKYVLNGLIQEMNYSSIPYHVSKFEFAKSDLVLWIKDCAYWLTENDSGLFEAISSYWIKLLQRKGGLLPNRIKQVEIKKLYTIIKQSIEHKNSFTNWLIHLIKKLNLEKIMSTIEDSKEELDYLTKLKKKAIEGEFETYNLNQFARLGRPDGQVSLSTRHSSKGLEYEVVIMIGMEKGVFPDYRIESIQEKVNEDRRLFFVCITRARRVCYLLMSNQYISRNGNPFTRYPSIFWKDLLKACEDNKFVTNRVTQNY